MTKLRREGFLASTISFVEKFSLALGPLVIGALLSAMGFDKNLDPSADQSPSTVQPGVGLVWIGRHTADGHHVDALVPAAQGRPAGRGVTNGISDIY
jgi:hypothetical protein